MNLPRIALVSFPYSLSMEIRLSVGNILVQETWRDREYIAKPREGGEEVRDEVGCRDASLKKIFLIILFCLFRKVKNL